MTDIELFNAHQEDVRKRADSIAKSVFLIAGTALTLSINMFLGKDAPKSITPDIAFAIRSAWVLLFISVACFVGVLSVMVVRDYRFGERWRSQLNGLKSDADDSPGRLDVLGWVLAVVGMVGLLGGLAVLAIVSSSLLP